ncbi:redox-sensing transcriptional repressor Rex [Oscillibacter valericigenes]|uniref:redox-sensing transcriptional repressor Rex n=1 Tax=Oscillibacter valericigenes TaxID=351091 RepID=UPI00195DA293|nr:redox-sensing transcriptional repressor Rex [Oscillibacter valericigenes]MBM6910907.1 redox-sensing transcriptional repressor Rex [Oscillibacter valericigenes]
MKKENISDAVIRRLPRYYRHLNELCSRGVVRISSHSLGQEMNITASQIRQDFSCFGEFGQQGYGYNVEELKAEIGHILGVDNDHHLIMIGVGNLGHALLQNFPFSQCGFTVDAAFDVSPAVIGTAVNGVPICSMSELDTFIQSHSVDVVVLTIPQTVAQDTADHLISLGVKGFWNFTNIELSSQVPDVQFENIHFADSLLTLSYRIANR